MENQSVDFAYRQLLCAELTDPSVVLDLVDLARQAAARENDPWWTDRVARKTASLELDVHLKFTPTEMWLAHA